LECHIGKKFKLYILRGRLNVLTSLLNLSPREIFSKIKGNSEFPKDFNATGDVLSHLGTISTIQYYNEKNPLKVSLINNPSHLESANSVVLGKGNKFY
jgi:probable 2-oxoglutarate dehydrogenase E1 component DHKTD1